MTALVELAPGVWARPNLVTAVISGTGGPAPRAVPASVRLMMGDTELIGWEFEGFKEAREWAATIARRVNDGQHTS